MPRKYSGRYVIPSITHRRGGITIEPITKKFFAESIFAGTLNADLIKAGTIQAGLIKKGTLDTVRIPNLSANKITAGTILGERIGSIPASRTASGTFGAVRIPNISASKINSGTFIGGNFIVGSPGIIKSTNYSLGTAGFQLHPTDGLRIYSGKVRTTALEGGALGAQAFISNSTFTVPAAVTSVYIFIVGGGGGGGGSGNGTNGGGGESGHILLGYLVSVTPGSGITITLGAGGSAGAAGAAGGDGGSSSFGSTTVPGGKGGASPANPAQRSGLSTGLGFSIEGPPGISDNTLSGPGANSPYGTGGAAVANQQNGQAASGYGTGGSGGGADPTGKIGGVGSPGYCLVIW